MNFKARIFIPKKLNYWKRNTLSEKISDLSGLFFLIVALIYYLFLRNINSESLIIKIFGFTMILPIFGLLISSFIRFKEYEIPKGDLINSISFENKGIQILDKLYLFSEIQNLHISYGNVVGDSINNSKYGPMFSIGVNNYIEFSFENKKITTYFQIQSRAQIEAIKEDLFHYVINETFPFEAKNLSFVDKQFHHYTLYKEFIEKMKREGKLS